MCCKFIQILTYQITGKNKSLHILNDSQTSKCNESHKLSIRYRCFFLLQIWLKAIICLPFFFFFFKHILVERFDVLKGFWLGKGVTGNRSVDTGHCILTTKETEDEETNHRHPKSDCEVKCWYYCESKRKSNF